jgi:hypothetical protein
MRHEERDGAPDTPAGAGDDCDFSGNAAWHEVSTSVMPGPVPGIHVFDREAD